MLPDPGNPQAFGSAPRRLLGDPDQTARMGQAAHARVGGHYLRDLHLFRYDKLLDRLIASG